MKTKAITTIMITLFLASMLCITPVSATPETWHVLANLADVNPFNDVEAYVTKTDKLYSVEFMVEIVPDAPHYGMGIAISTSVSTISFQVWYKEYDPSDYGWHYQEYGTGWGSQPEYHLPYLGITATGDHTGKLFTVEIPIALLGGYGAEYYFAIQFRTTLLGTYPSGLDLWAQIDASQFAAQFTPRTVVPDPGFETNNDKTGLHYFWAGSGCTAEITTAEKYAGRKSARLRIPGNVPYEYATIKTDISPGSTKPSDVWFDGILAPPTFMYKLTTGSRSPYWVFKIKIVGGPYDGQRLVLISWQLDGLTPDGWTLYDNDDWHYIVEDWTTDATLVNDFSTDASIDPFTPESGHWHHPLSEIQGYFDGTLETVQVSIGLWPEAWANEVYVDQMRVIAMS